MRETDLFSWEKLTYSHARNWSLANTSVVRYVPLEQHIEKRHLEKSNKYAHFVTDCSSGTMKCQVTCFEISSRGLITPRNSEHLHTIHKYTHKGLKLSTFKKNVSALSVLSSFHIWLCRSDPTFQEPPFLPAPFQEKTKEIPARTAGQ